MQHSHYSYKITKLIGSEEDLCTKQRVRKEGHRKKRRKKKKTNAQHEETNTRETMNIELRVMSVLSLIHRC